MSNLKRLSLVVIMTALCVATYKIYSFYESFQCPLPEITRERPIAGTDWLVQMRGQFCDFGLNLMTDVRVIKQDGSDIIVLVTGSDINQIYLDTSQPRELTLAIPDRLRDIEFHHSEIPGVEVSLRFLTPEDDKSRLK